MFDSNHVQNDFIYQTGGSILTLSHRCYTSVHKEVHEQSHNMCDRGS
jgi:hypothetical protein